jgi:hypothetical protein
VTRERLIAHAEGRTSARERWELEMEATIDPLLQDALDGMHEEGAVEALRSLQRPAHVPATGTPATWWLLGATLLVGAGSVLWWNNSQQTTAIAEVGHQASALVRSTPTAPPSDAPVELPTAPEVEAATEIPTAMRIGHGPEDKHMLPESVTREPVRDQAPEPMSPVAITPTSSPEATPAPKTTDRTKRTSVQLVFLSGLKLVQPNELYGHDPSLLSDGLGVEAAYADREAQMKASSEARLVGYLSFMDEAMARFARNDHRGCLEELRFLLRQYPDDVNAIFYAGLCCYNLGLYERAEALLGRAATHSMDVFDEEAAWYHALTLQRLGRYDEAVERMEHIAQAGGFYAERARDLLNKK